jgi:hypothetical protein
MSESRICKNYISVFLFLPIKYFLHIRVFIGTITNYGGGGASWLCLGAPGRSAAEKDVFDQQKKILKCVYRNLFTAWEKIK